MKRNRKQAAFVPNSGYGREAHPGLDTAKLVLTVVFITLIFVPLGIMFAHMDGSSIRAVIQAPNFWLSICHSLTVAASTTVITLVLSLLLAKAVHRSNIRGKGVFEVLIVLPMLIPSISCGMGLIILLGNNGLLTNLFDLRHTVYGIHGIILGSVIFSLPVAYLMLSDVFRYEDLTPYEAAQILGIPKCRQFFAITLPYLSKPLIRAAFAVFTLVITDYGVPLMVGGKYTTLPVVMYQEVVGQLDFAKGSVYGCLLLIPAVAAFVIDLMYKDMGNSQYVTRQIQSKDSLGKTVWCYGCCIAASVAALLPILSFGVLVFASDYPNDLSWTFGNILRAFQLRAGKYWLNSVFIAFTVAALGSIIAFICAYLSARTRSPLGRFLHLSTMTSAAIPGLVLGLSYVLAFRRTGLYGTLMILVLVNLIHFISSPYLMMFNSLSKINGNLESVAQTLRIGRLYMIRDILLPQCRNTLVEMFVYFFVNCMMTISAVSFLANAKIKPVSLMINQFEAQSQLECAAVVSLMILLTNLIMKAMGYLLKKYWK